MDIGMLWFDDSTRTMDEKIKRAVAFYAEKYGRTPTLCMVNPTTAQADGIVGGIQVRPARTVLPHHFLVGIEDEKGSEKRVPAKPRPGQDASLHAPAEVQPAPDAGQGGRQLEMDLKGEVEASQEKQPKRRRPAVPAMDGQAA